jgi:hypothetical protein
MMVFLRRNPLYACVGSEAAAKCMRGRMQHGTGEVEDENIMSVPARRGNTVRYSTGQDSGWVRSSCVARPWRCSSVVPHLLQPTRCRGLQAGPQTKRNKRRTTQQLEVHDEISPGRRGFLGGGCRDARVSFGRCLQLKELGVAR